MRKEDNGLLRRWGRPLLWGSAVGIVTCAVLLAAFAALFASQPVPTAWIAPVGLVGAALGALAAGFVGARVMKQKGLLIGLLCGLTLYLLVTLCGLLFLHTVGSARTLLKMALMLAASAAGGVLAMNIKKKKK
ncbi:MAG: TIGR04086 family membrane protein [Oscillospiraceae bacterium]|nr:TIGR04086 family membrane protein [Oscillospiraceae bacterium]